MSLLDESYTLRITNDGDAYRYLAEYIGKFPAPEILAEELEEQDSKILLGGV